MVAVSNLSTNTGLSALPDLDQKQYPEVWQDLYKVRNALRVLQTALDRYTGITGEDSSFWSTAGSSWVQLQNLSRVYYTATEAINAGAIVNIYNNAGVTSVRNANASAAGKPAHAFSTGNVAVGAVGEFQMFGLCQQISGMTAGTTYYLSNTNGLISSSAGTVAQKIGFALEPTKLFFRSDLI